MVNTIADTLLLPDWPAPANVKAIQTTRLGGLSVAPYDALNLGDHVGDDAMTVTRNRQLLNSILPTEPIWLKQVHGISVIDASTSRCIEAADASFSRQSNVVCTVMTADCLPVLLCDKQGSVVAAVHAGWRGLCDGVIEETVRTMQIPTNNLMAWLGPAIGPQAFEVGGEVRERFTAKDPQAKQAFITHKDRWLANLYTLACLRLQSVGVTKIYGQEQCTYTNIEQYFSYRREGVTGRMATMIWLTS